MRNRLLISAAGFAVVASVGLAPAASAQDWDTLAECESSGDWSINTGNGYSGGLQFAPSTWAAFGGTEYAPEAAQATRAQQIAVAERVLAAQGPGAWPACSEKTSWQSGASSAPEPKPTENSSESAVQPEQSASGNHTVKSGETLGSISAQYGANWRAVFKQNPSITDPHLIYPGQVLAI